MSRTIMAGAGPVGLEAARFDDDHLHAERGGLGAEHTAEAALAGAGRGLLSRAAEDAGSSVTVQAMNHAIATYWQVAAAQT